MPQEQQPQTLESATLEARNLKNRRAELYLAGKQDDPEYADITKRITSLFTQYAPADVVEQARNNVGSDETTLSDEQLLYRGANDFFDFETE
jgi:hypothetical protein